jgi:hypothetical protein
LCVCPLPLDNVMNCRKQTFAIAFKFTPTEANPLFPGRHIQFVQTFELS